VPSSVYAGAALAEAGRLISTGDGFDLALYDERNDAEIMDAGAIRRWFGLDRSPHCNNVSCWSAR
jgi:hypothetical protein